ncbi:MAG: hypothetical protein FJW80_07910 [Actinobacteria bacterium]|nr:hypothetical protein [Actinomycetota bacterium]
MTFTVTTMCLGNICRSPMAEAIMRARVDDVDLSRQVVVNPAVAGIPDADPRLDVPDP